MDTNEKKAIQNFYNAVAKLKELEIIQSDTYLGDIGEYITKCSYNIKLAESRREPNIDGHNDEGRIQVKYHGSSKGTNVNLGNPLEYDILLVVLGSDSLLRDLKFKGDFLVYKMTSEEVKAYKNIDEKTGEIKSYSCGKKAFKGKPDKELNLNT